jgi:hypothetical protein
MALARIISRSHQCSRELALDLLARGYAVEIVSPDAIPDNLADLELRVEADAANELTATVEARDGTHAASLDFVHHLKAPMRDFVRRPPETSEAAYFLAQPVSFNTEQGVAYDVELPSENWRAPEPARPKLEILPAPEESARLVALPEQLPPLTKEPAKHVRRGVSITIHRSNTKSEQNRMTRSGGWLWRAVMTFAAVIVVALVLGRGIRRGDAVSVPQDSQNGPGKTATAPDANLLTNAEPEHEAAPVAVPTAAGKLEAKPAPISKEPVTPRGAKFRKSQVARSRRRGDDLVAPDTVIYLDRPASVAPVRDPSRRRTSSHKQSGGVAPADTSPI